MKKRLIALYAMGAVALSTPATAAVVVVSSSPNTGCNNAPLSPAANTCAGYYSQNAFSNSGADVAAQQNAINLLVGAGNYTVDYNALKLAGDVIGNKDVDALNALLANVSGEVILGIHWGNVPDGDGPRYGNVSAFYLWNNAPTGSIHLTDTSGFSDAVLYVGKPGAVPEPATWAMMLLGFGAMGLSFRRRSAPALAQVA